MLGLLSSGISDFVLLPSHISKIFNFFPLSSRRVSIPVPNGRDTRGYGFVSFESLGCQPRPNRDNNIIDQGQPSSRALASFNALDYFVESTRESLLSRRRKPSRNGLGAIGVVPPASFAITRLAIGKTLSNSAEPRTSRRCNFTFDSLPAAAPASFLSSRRCNFAGRGGKKRSVSSSVISTYLIFDDNAKFHAYAFLSFPPLSFQFDPARTLKANLPR